MVPGNAGFNQFFNRTGLGTNLNSRPPQTKQRGKGVEMEEAIQAPLVEFDEEGEDRSFVEEAGEIAIIVKRVVSSEGKDAESVYDRWKQIVSTLECQGFRWFKNHGMPAWLKLGMPHAAVQVPGAVPVAGRIPGGDRRVTVDPAPPACDSE